MTLFCPCSQNVNYDKSKKDEDAELGKEDTLENPDHELPRTPGDAHIDTARIGLYPRLVRFEALNPRETEAQTKIIGMYDAKNYHMEPSRRGQSYANNVKVEGLEREGVEWR